MQKTRDLFDGRINRLTYLTLHILLFIATFINVGLDARLVQPFPYSLTTFSVSVVIFWIIRFLSVLVKVKRLHDIGHSGWWALGFAGISHVSVVMPESIRYFLLIIVALFNLYLLLRKGEVKNNKYGDLPKPFFLQEYVRYSLRIKILLQFVQFLFIWAFIAHIVSFIASFVMVRGIDCTTQFAQCQQVLVAQLKVFPILLVLAFAIAFVIQKYVLKINKLVNTAITSLSIIMVIGFSVFMAYVAFHMVSAQRSQSQQAMQGWKMHAQENLFQVAYPETWQQIPSEGQYRDSYIAFSDAQDLESTTSGRIYLQIAWGPNDSSYDRLFEKKEGNVEKGNGQSVTTLQKIPIGNNPAVLQLEETTGKTASESSYAIAAYIKGPSNVRVAMAPLRSEETKPEAFITTYFPTFLQMLSSFTFKE